MPDLLYSAVCRAFYAITKAMDYDFTVIGADNIPRQGGVLVACNHVSYLDFVLGAYAPWTLSRRYPRFMAKKEVFDHPVAGPLMRGMHHIPVDRQHGTQSMEDAVGYLRRGEMVAIFPEATISRSMEVKDIKSGAVRIAQDAEVPILPIAIWGGQQIMTKDHPIDRSRHKSIVIVVGEPMRVHDDDIDAQTEQLRSRLRDLVDVAIENYPERHRPKGAWWMPAARGGSAPTPEVAAEMDAAEKLRRVQRKASSTRG